MADLTLEQILGTPNQGGAKPTFAEIISKASIRPLQRGEFRSNPDGSRSSELSITTQIDGKWFNIPSLWMTPNGTVELEERDAVETARKFMKETGMAFPTFNSVEEAIATAKTRSAGGGVAQGSLAR